MESAFILNNRRGRFLHGGVDKRSTESIDQDGWRLLVVVCGLVAPRLLLLLLYCIAALCILQLPCYCVSPSTVIALSLLGWATGLINLKLVMELANPLLTA